MQSLVAKGPGHVFKAQKRSMEIGTAVVSEPNPNTGKGGGAPYPLYHQLGAGHNPVRKPIDLQHMDTGPAGYFGRALVEWGNDVRKAWA
jgi:hypothetical protein